MLSQTGPDAIGLGNQLLELSSNCLTAPLCLIQKMALSSGEAELHANGQGISEALFAKNILLDAKLTKQAKLTGRRVVVLERNLNTLNFVFCTRRT